MAKLEVVEEGDGLVHAHVAVDLEAHVGYRPPRHDQAHAVLRDDVQPRRLQTRTAAVNNLAPYKYMPIGFDRFELVVITNCKAIK